MPIRGVGIPRAGFGARRHTVNRDDPTSAVARAVEDLILLVFRRGGDVDGRDRHALTTTQRLMLVLIVDHEPLRLGALARLAETTEATATRTVSALAEIGLARRASDPDDGRAVMLGATPEGRALVDGRRRAVLAALDRGMASLDEPERRRLAELLAQVVTVVHDLREEARPQAR